MPEEPSPPSLFLANLDQRTTGYRRNERLDALLAELKSWLEPAERAAIASFDELRAPALLVVGNPRSGTTVFMQCLAASGMFAVPGNLLSRFYYAPFLGAKIQQLLCDPAYAYKDELADLRKADVPLSSEHGKTRGALAPSEFFHFWRRFIPNYDPEYLDEERSKLIDGAGLRQSIAAIEAAFQKPFAAKAIILQYNLRAVAEALRKVLFVYLKRHPFFVMQSILLARESFYGDRSKWWSVKPREYAELRGLHPLEQIAGQVWHTEQSMREQAQLFSAEQWLEIDYAEFCRKPSVDLDRIAAAYRERQIELSPQKPVPEELPSGDTVRLPPEDVDRLLAAYAGFSGTKLEIPADPTRGA